MLRRARLYLVGSLALVLLAGCGRGLFQMAEREPWRREAEVACLKSGIVKEGIGLVRIEPIEGPGICGADYPLKVVALGGATAMGFADELRPPGGIPVHAQPTLGAPPSTLSAQRDMLAAPSIRVERTALPSPQTSMSSPMPSSIAPRTDGPTSLYAPGIAAPPPDDEVIPGDDADVLDGARGRMVAPNAMPPRDPRPLPSLGPQRGSVTSSIGPVAIKPAATLACPIVSAVDRWVADAIQPSAMRWFGSPVAEIKQISAYSCRGMNGNSRARISEHAFGNALDIAAFVLADGRTVSVKTGWKGAPEEQGFLRDVQAAACQQFSTVLAPGSNVYHYDHIHVDLMRRSSGRVICQPAAVSGDVVAARAGGSAYAARAGVTGSITALIKRATTRRAPQPSDEDALDE